MKLNSLSKTALFATLGVIVSFTANSAFAQDKPATEDKPINLSDFSYGMGDWFLEVKSPAEASAEIVKEGETPVMKIEIAEPGTEKWDVQLMRSKLGATKGQHYKVTFEAKAEGGLNLWCQLQEDGGSYGAVGKAMGVGIVGDWKEYTLNFSAEGLEKEMVKARLILGNLGVAGKTLWLKNVKWTTVTATPPTDDAGK